MVKLVSERQDRTISGPRKRILSAITPLSGATGALANPSVAIERNAVRNRERRDRLQQRPAVFDDEKQAEDKEQMIDTEEDLVQRPLKDHHGCR